MQKPTNYPMAVVLSVKKNSIDEVTTVTVRKGANREVVTRHVDSIIPLLSVDLQSDESVGTRDLVAGEAQSARPPRKTAAISRSRTAKLVSENSV